VPFLKRLLNIFFVLAAVVVAGLVVRHFMNSGWPLHHANFWLVALAGIVTLGGYLTKAWGWQRLFHHEARPAVLTLAAAGGAASVGGIALPGRFDEVLHFAVVRRCRRSRVSFGAVALSLFVLGLLDSAALSPLAGIAIGLAHIGGWLHAGLIVVTVAGVLSAALVFALPRLTKFRGVTRFRLGRWVGANSTSPRETAWAWAAIAVSWALRTVAVFVLLAALGLGTDFALALAFVCAASASSVLPIAPAGAAMQAGAGAAILVASGIHSEEAIAFGIAAQALVIAVGAGFVMALGAWHAQGRLQQFAVAGHLRRMRTLA
jgi:uncharacterized membrane protein YbhN (UPF0104 family)